MTNRLDEPGPSVALAEFVACSTRSVIPPPVAELAAAHLAAVLSSAVSGSAASPAAAVLLAVARSGASRDATVIGRGVHLPAPYAAFVNATAATTAGADRTAAVVGCAALALAEREQAPGSGLLLATALGLEVAQRVARSLGPSHVSRGYDLAGTAGRVGAAAASASILGLPADAVLACFGYAATTAAGLGTGPAEVRASVAGLASSDGVWAALLAGAGLLGPAQPLEGRRGLLALESASGDPELLVAGLGSSWMLESLSPPSQRAGANADDDLGALDGAANVGEIVVATEALSRRR